MHASDCKGFCVPNVVRCPCPAACGAPSGYEVRPALSPEWIDELERKVVWAEKARAHKRNDGTIEE